MLNTLLAVVISGIATGVIYSLVVLGVNLIVLVRRVLHFGFPYIVILSAFLDWQLLGWTHDNWFICLPAFFILGIVLTLISELMFRNLARKGAFLESMIMGQGIAIIVVAIGNHFFNHGLMVSFPHSILGSGIGIKIGLIYFTLGNIYTLVGGIIFVVLLYLFLFRSMQGRAIRAMAQNRDVATDLGISFNRTGLIGFAFAGILAGATALFLAMILRAVDSATGDALAVRVLILAMFAGMGNLTGGLICALLMGAVEAVAQTYVGGLSDAVVFAVLMVIILLRPNGVFGAKT